MDPKPLKQNIVFFTVLFASCIIGSIAIFLFGVGMETGNPIVRNCMKVLVENVFWVMAGFVLFNALIFWIYRLGKRRST